MSNEASVGRPVPNLAVSAWVQGGPIQLSDLRGRVALIEVFQLNCPGCFLYALPRAVELHQRYAGQGLTVLGVATAFEDFDKNTLENLQRLLDSGEVVGETRRCLNDYGLLKQGRWPCKLPFPLAMDRLTKANPMVSDDDVDAFIQQKLPECARQTDHHQKQTKQRIIQYLQKLEYRAETFERFNLQGTPSQLLVDKQGILRTIRFGDYPELESDIQHLLAE